MCDWFTGKRRSFSMDWTLGKIMQYSNMNHSCPYMGNVMLKVDNISMDTFVFEQFVPAGRYRIDFNMSNDYIPLFIGRIFASVSDHRVEQF